MLAYLSFDIICSSKLTVTVRFPYFHTRRRLLLIYITREQKYLMAHSLCSRKTGRFLEQIMSADKYPSIFLCQVEAIVYSVEN